MNTPTSLILADAESLYESGQCDQAVALLAEAYLKDHSHMPFLEKLGEFLIDSGRYESALEWLLQAEDGGGYPRMSLLMAICKEAIGDLLSARILTEKVEHYETLSAEALSLKGRIALAGNDFTEAEMLFQQAAAREESCASGWFGLSRIHNLKGDVERSFHFLEKAFFLNPQSREISTAFHDISLVTNKMAESEAMFRQTLRERPKNRRLRFFLIDLLLRQSRYSDAMGEIERSLADFGVEAGLLAAAGKVRQSIGPLEINQSRKGQNSVSLCMIVKNERDHLCRCLYSVKPLVDEIIIVDTGSTDETKEIASVFGASVYDLVWSEDFSEARNFALSMARGDWVLVLDADEVLSAADTEKFKQTLYSAPAKPSAFRIQTRNYTNKCNIFGFKTNQGEFSEEQGVGWYPSDKVRLFTNDPRIRFEYPVHELVEPSLKRSNISVQDCPVVVHHYGTLKDGKTLQKTRKYSRLEKRKLKTTSKNLAALKETAVQAAQLGNHLNALERWQEFVKIQPYSAEAFLNMSSACWNLGRYNDAVAYAVKASRLNPQMKEAHFNQALALLCIGKAGKAKVILERLRHKESNYHAAQFLLCVASACEGEKARCAVEIVKLRSTQLGPHLEESFVDMAEKLCSAGQIQYARRTVEAAVAAGFTESRFRTMLLNCLPAA